MPSSPLPAATKRGRPLRQAGPSFRLSLASFVLHRFAVLLGETVCVETPGEIAYRHVVVRAAGAVCKLAVTRACGHCAPADGFSHQVVSAVGEAFNNIALHSYRDRPSDIVRLRMTIEPRVLHLTMEDYGAGFDPLTAVVPDLEALPESGLGIFIMRSLMDQVTYQRGRPNVLSLSKWIGECSSVGFQARGLQMDFATDR